MSKDSLDVGLDGAGGVPDPIDGTSCMDKKQGFSPGAPLLSEYEGTGHSIMMTPNSDAGTRVTWQRGESAV
jgi:hypothetical protein